jgi:hypothetical protein
MERIWDDSERKTQVLGQKRVLLPFRLPQIRHGLTQDRNGTYVGSYYREVFQIFSKYVICSVETLLVAENKISDWLSHSFR